MEAEKLGKCLKLLQEDEYLVKSNVGRCTRSLLEQHKLAITALLDSLRNTATYRYVKDVQVHKMIEETVRAGKADEIHYTSIDERGESVGQKSCCKDFNFGLTALDFATVLLLMWPYGRCEGTNGQVMRAAIEETLNSGIQVYYEACFPTLFS